MSKGKVVMVGPVPHQRVSRLVARDGPIDKTWAGSCTCGRMEPAYGRPGQIADLWRKHVEAEAQRLGLVARPSRHGKAPEQAVALDATCPECGWQGRRRAPYPGYRGPLGPCPRCRARVLADPPMERP